MITVQRLSYEHPSPFTKDTWDTLFHDLSFMVKSGECLGIVGPNGSGKTTLCLTLAGLAPRLTSGRIQGQIRVFDRDVQVEPVGWAADIIGLVMQDLTGQLFNETVEDEIAWGLGNLGLPAAAMPDRIRNALAAAGLPDGLLKRPVTDLSGGEQKRLAIAAALALQPRVLILDTPTGGLSPLARRILQESLIRLRRETNLTIVLADNDLDLLTAVADQVLFLDDGIIVDSASVYDAVVAKPYISSAASVFSMVVNARSDYSLTCLTTEEAIRQTASIPIVGDCQPPVAAPSPVEAPQVAIEVAHLTYSYDGVNRALEAVDLSIPVGQFVAILGDNGAGKTTFAKHLIGLLRPQEGVVRVMGKDAARLSIGQLAAQVGYVFQNSEDQIFSATLREEIVFGPGNLGFSPDRLNHAVARSLERFGLEALADLPPAAFSFSNRRLAALSSIAAMETPILALDEPTVGLDREKQALVGAWLSEWHKNGGTILLITHEMDFAARYAERVLVFDRGRLIVDACPEAAFSNASALISAGVEKPFSLALAEALECAALAGDLTPEGTACFLLGGLK
nr:ATP-binding cassette domain-containing protein [Anaerolineae bacterium]